MLKQIFLAKGSQAAYDVAVPDSNTAFLDSWASGYARDPSLGAAWDTTGVGITATKPLIPFYAGSGNTQVSMDAGPRSSAIARVQIADQVLIVSGSGGPAFGRMRDASGSTLDLEPAAYCVTGQDCSCPQGSPGFGDTLPGIAPGPAWVALSGSNVATHITLARVTAASWCQHPVGGTPGGVSHITVSGGASATSFQNGHNDSCTIHQTTAFGKPELQCYFEMFEPGEPCCTQVTFHTYGNVGPGQYDAAFADDSMGPEVGYADLATSYVTSQMATTTQPDGYEHWQTDPGGFTITNETATTISGTISATMEDAEQPNASTHTATAGGTFTVPLQILPN
jgi:hypothetical protein